MRAPQNVRIVRQLVSNVVVDTARSDAKTVQLDGNPLDLLRATATLEATGFDCEIRETSRGWVGFVRLFVGCGLSLT